MGRSLFLPLCLAILAVASGCASEPVKPGEQVASDKCVPTTGSNLCRGSGAATVTTLSRDAIESTAPTALGRPAAPGQ